MIGRLHAWVSNHHQALGAWSAIVTIISLPVAIIALIFGFYQIKEILIEPSAELEFVNPDSIAYMVKNTSDKTIEDVLVSFGIFDLDILSDNRDQLRSMNPLQLPSRNYDYVNRNAAKGPFSLFSNQGRTGHRYFGIVYISCKGCKTLETYWLYVKDGARGESFYTKRRKEDSYELNALRLAADAEKYIEQIVPVTRRIYIYR